MSSWENSLNTNSITSLKVCGDWSSKNVMYSGRYFKFFFIKKIQEKGNGIIFIIYHVVATIPCTIMKYVQQMRKIRLLEEMAKVRVI